MNKAMFEKKLAGIPEVTPDEIDSEMLAEIDAEYDATDEGRSLDDILAERNFNGRILVRVPKSLHEELFIKAKQEGVSLNQYLLYKICR
jgi:predicted HicB family RNase H-like nuclease